MLERFSLARQCLRSLCRAPGFTFSAVLILALGLAGVVALTAAIHALLLKPLPYQEANRLVAIEETRITGGQREVIPAGPGDFHVWRREAKSFHGMALYRTRSAEVDGSSGPEAITCGAVSPGFFQVLGRPAALGQSFAPADAFQGAAPVVMLSHGYWNRRFAGDTNVLGHSIVVNGIRRTIVGVAAKGMVFPLASEQAPDLFLPIMDMPEARQEHSFKCVARLSPGTDIARANAELRILQEGLEKQFPESNLGNGAQVRPLQAALMGDRAQAMGLLAGASALLLLLACVDVAGLFLARALARRQECGIRSALGASGLHLFGPFAVEALLVALGAAVVGLALAWPLVKLLPAVFPEAMPLPGAPPLGLDAPVLAVAFLLCALSAGAFAFVPLIQVRRSELAELLRSGDRAQTGGRGRLRGALVAGELALALMMLAGSGLLMRSFGSLLGRDLGFRIHNLTGFQVSLSSRPQFRDPAGVARFHAAIAQSIGAIAGVDAYCAASQDPIEEPDVYGFVRPGGGQEPDSSCLTSAVVSVSPGYFKTLGIRLLRGRDFGQGDAPGAPRVALVNESFAARFFSGQDPVGQIVRSSYGAQDVQIVGLLKNWRVGGPEGQTEPMLVFPISQYLNGAYHGFIQGRIPLLDAGKYIRKAVGEAAPGMAVQRIGTEATFLHEALAQRRNTLILLGCFSALSLFLASAGLYGVVAYAVTQRRREIGLRMALGGTAREILRLVLGQGLSWIGVGAGAGILGSLAAGRLIQSQLVDMGPQDPLALALALAVLVAVALLACLIPALRAARIDPAVALRSE